MEVAPVYTRGVLSDDVWFDENADGEQDANAPDVPGAVITLTSSWGLVLIRTTHANGH